MSSITLSMHIKQYQSDSPFFVPVCLCLKLACFLVECVCFADDSLGNGFFPRDPDLAFRAFAFDSTVLYGLAVKISSVVALLSRLIILGCFYGNR